MSEHTIMFLTDGETISDKFTSPSRLAQPGDTYEFTNTISTIGKKVYDTGDRLNIIERTEKAPHNRVSSLGNLLVKCKYYTSV